MLAHIKAAGAGLIAALTISVVAATAAQAGTGPSWTINGTSPITANLATTSESLSEVTLKGAIEVICLKLTNTGKIIAELPGTDSAVLTFSGCVLGNGTGTRLEKCTVTGKEPISSSTTGTIEVDVKTVLVYPNGHQGSTTEAYDAFVAEGNTAHPNLFSKFKIATEPTECGTLLSGKEESVEAVGTTIAKFSNKACGQLATVGKHGATGFETTVSGALFEEGALNSPAASKKAELNTGGEAFAPIECKLEAHSGEVEQIAYELVLAGGAGQTYGWINE
jgi:hypothetical protein